MTGQFEGGRAGDADSPALPSSSPSQPPIIPFSPKKTDKRCGRSLVALPVHRADAQVGPYNLFRFNMKII